MDALRMSIRDFCESDLAVKQCQTTYRELCEPSLVRRNTSYASLVRVMQDDNLDILELATGGFLRKTMVKTQCALKREVVLAAVEAAVADFRQVSRDIDTMDRARASLLKLIKKYVREHRTSDVVKVTHITTLPRGMSEYDVPRASEFIADTANTWMSVQKELSEARRAHTDTKKALEAKRESCLDLPGVRDYIKQECPDGKPVRIQGHDSNFTLRYTESRRRCPIREAHVQESISHAVETLLTDPATPVAASALADLIMDTARTKAGGENIDTFTLCARTGRKRDRE